MVDLEGSGFAGFWYHMGLFHKTFSSINQQGRNSSSVINADTNFYCYSSGCISLLLSAVEFISSHKNETNSIVNMAYDAAHRSQRLWLQGDINQYEIVQTFLHDVFNNKLLDHASLLTFLPRLHILITTGRDGAQMRRAQSIEELIRLLRKTTWIPFVTGDGFGKPVRKQPGCEINSIPSCTNDTTYESSFTRDHGVNDWFLDGGFSRTIHPRCERTIAVPTNWMTMLHSLNPKMGRKTVLELWSMGLNDSVSLLEENAMNRRDYQVIENIYSLGTAMKGTI
jgi:hypothetical protein